MKIINVDNLFSEDWDNFIKSRPDASSCHQFAWSKVIADSFGHQCYYLGVLDESQNWLGILPLAHIKSKIFGNFLVSIPFVNYGGLLYKDKEVANILINEAENIRKSLGANYVEIRQIVPAVEYLPTKQHKVTMILNLSASVNEQWKVFNPKLRNQIRKAEKSNLLFSMGHLDLLDEFYKVFTHNMRDLGTPVYSKKFFYNILKSFRDTTRIFAVRYQDNVIAAGIALWFRDTLEIPWASSISLYREFCPNNMLYWEAIRFSIENGFKKFDFGRSTPHEGTYNFKKQWGALPIQLNWQYLTDVSGKLPELDRANPKYQIAIRIWKHLPIPVTRMIGPLIVRNIP